jgi:hypothetical protein
MDPGTAGVAGLLGSIVGGPLPPEVVNSSPFRIYWYVLLMPIQCRDPSLTQRTPALLACPRSFKILPCPRKHGHDWTACPFSQCVPLGCCYPRTAVPAHGCGLC